MYDTKIAMIQGGGGSKIKPMTKRKINNIEFNHHDQIIIDHQGTEPIIIKATIG